MRKGVKLEPGNSAYKLSLEVTASQGITKYVFVKQRHKKTDNTWIDTFVAVASAANVADFDENSPAAGESYFRTSKVELTSSNSDHLEDVFNNILAELQLLADQTEILDELQVDGIYTINSSTVTVDMAQIHTHYRIPLIAEPCGINEVYVDPEDEAEKHRVASQNAELSGWLNTSGSDPDTTFFKYNIAEDPTVAAIWPIPTEKLSYAHIEINGVVSSDVLINANGIFWKNNQWGKVPWPKTYVNSEDLGDPVDKTTLVLDVIA